MSESITVDAASPSDSIVDLEHQIYTATDASTDARTALRLWLLNRAGIEPNGTIGDALLAMVRNSQSDRTVAIVLLRSLSVRGLLPEGNATNQIQRLLTEICTKSVPDICSFVGVKTHNQTYENFSALSTAHSNVCGLLSPLTETYGDLLALISARKRILGALNHSIIRGYCRPFQFQEIKNCIESLFTRLEKVHSLEVTFFQDFEGCLRSNSEMRQLVTETQSFLTEIIITFINNSDRTLGQFLYAVRSNYHARIIKGWGDGSEIQKRYPLHEIGREFHIVIPLRNEGTGVAVDVRVTAITSSDSIAVSNHTISMGSVSPGDFSVVLDAIVAETCDGFTGLLEIQWSEIGNPERLSETYQFDVKTQNSEIDWSSLEYWTPYSTTVAEGDNFIGRSDLVKALSSKLLRTPIEPFYITGQKRVGKTSLSLGSGLIVATR